ncbi:MAG: hypothetical protein Q8M22_02965 [Actinomycetota bacterium]|nr:hypothetical protein [Actinomycetota bacterium]
MHGRPLSWVMAGVALAACTDGGAPNGSPPSAVSTMVTAGAELDGLLAITEPGRWRSTGDDRFEVWICHVTQDATAAIYGALPLRLALTPEQVTSVVAEHVTPYFETLSHGRYRPVFVAGGEATLAVDDEPQACIDEAIAGAAGDTRAVLVVADAEHGADQQGGFGSGGGSCTSAPPCAVADSRRFAYVGASDFHPDWGAAPPMDLVQHEIGHTIGWEHSALGPAGEYLSALDVMSNSAAPRQLEAERRDASGTLAVNLFTAGWLAATDVWVAPAGGGSVQLAPSLDDAGTRLAVLPCCSGSLVTVELLAAEGLNAHLPSSGIAVHVVAVGDATVQRIDPLFGEPPFTSLLQPGDVLATSGWVITVGDDFSITVTPDQPT